MPSKFTLWYALFALAVVASLCIAYNPKTTPVNDSAGVQGESARP